MENIINIKIDISDESFGGRLKITSDKQLYDEWTTGDISQSDFEFSEETLTAVYERLYDITQSNRVGSGDPIFKIEGEMFAEMVDGFHLKLNDELSHELIEKYGKVETLNFQTKNEIEQTYGATIQIDGIALEKSGDMAYSGYESDNYIKDKDFNRDFKNKDEALKALDYYLEEDTSKRNFNYIDRTVITVDGAPYKEMILNKTIENKAEKQEVEEPKEKKKNRTRLRR